MILNAESDRIAEVHVTRCFGCNDYLQRSMCGQTRWVECLSHQDRWRQLSNTCTAGTSFIETPVLSSKTEVTVWRLLSWLIRGPHAVSQSYHVLSNLSHMKPCIQQAVFFLTSSFDF